MDIHHPLVGAELELLTGFFVNVRLFEHGKDFLFGRQRNRTAYNSARHFDGLNDLLRRFIDQVVIVGLEFDANTMAHSGDLVFFGFHGLVLGQNVFGNILGGFGIVRELHGGSGTTGC